MESEERILFAVDDSKASENAATYLSRFISKYPNVRVRLLHVLPSMTSNLLEAEVVDLSSSSEPEEWQWKQQRLEEARSRWLKKAEKEVQPLFDKIREILGKAGVDRDSIDTRCYVPIPEESVASGILQSARKEAFDTIVLGREAFPWYLELFHHHVSNEVEHKGHGLAIWIVE